MKYFGIAFALILLAGAGVVYGLYTYIGFGKPVQESLPEDFKNASYTIGGELVQLSDGKSEVAIVPGSAAMVVTQYFGNEVYGDIDGDGDEDAAFLITQNSGGTGTYFYLVAALKEEGGYRGTNAVLIGDRIAPQTTEFRDAPLPEGSRIIVNYADRKPGEPMTAQPSEGKSLYLKYDASSNSFGEVVQNFEGEADPKKMSLGMKPWVWVSSSYENGKHTIPKSADVFVLTFNTDGTFSATTDCNQAGGSYTADGEAVSFSKIFSTKMYCEGSQETEFLQMLESVAGYSFTSKGELVLSLKYDSGTSVFR